MSPAARSALRVAAPLAVLAVVVHQVGAGPFLDGLRLVDGRALAAATILGALTTICCAWRWTIVARGLGVELSLGAAVAAYYRSLFLNVTLPGGIVGDVHRGVSHGRAANDLGRGLRAVAWERVAGQIVQAVLTLAVLFALPSPVQPSMPLVAVGLGVAMVAVLLVARVSRTAAGDIRDALLARGAWPAIAALSAVVVCGHAATFLIAADTAGVSAPPSQMVPLALLVMLVMVLPSVGGWGPREGAAAWAFGAAGLGAAQGVTTAVVYGVLVFAACLPGLAVIAVSWFRGWRPARRPARSLADEPVHA